MTERLLQSFAVLLSGLFSAERREAQKPTPTALGNGPGDPEHSWTASSTNGGEHEPDHRLH